MKTPKPEAVQEGSGSMEFLRESPSDISAIRKVVQSAFPSDDEARPVEALRAAGDAVLSVVAKEDRLVVGHAMLSRMTAPFPALGLAPVAVLPSRQKQRIGSRLVAFALDLARREDWIGVFVLGDPKFYKRFGFSVDLAEGFQSPYAGPYFMALPLVGRLPVLSGSVDYAPAFADLG